jgi:hypothetical protein
MHSELASRVAAEYGKLLRRLKRADVDIATAPRDVQEAMLALHQNALLHHSSSVAPGTATVDAGPFTGSRVRHS